MRPPAAAGQTGRPRRSNSRAGLLKRVITLGVAEARLTAVVVLPTPPLILVTAMIFTARAYAGAEVKRKRPAAWCGRGAGLLCSHEPVVHQYAEVAQQQQECGDHR